MAGGAQAFKRLANALPRAVANLSASDIGKCNVCGNSTIFVCLDRSTRRNHMYCMFCQSVERKRHVTSVLLRRFFPGSPSISEIPASDTTRVLSTYLADPWRGRARAPGFIYSGYLPGVPFGTPIGDRGSCQSLEDLKYPDGSFDVIVTEDVLEHVRDYRKAFEEIRRALVPGGTHIFTVPFMFDRDTLVRVDSSGPDDVHLVLPPEYHGTHLAYRTFGRNLLPELEVIGFETTAEHHGDSYVFISRRV